MKEVQPQYHWINQRVDYHQGAIACRVPNCMGKVIHPSMGILSPAADTSLSDNGVVFASVEKLAATLSSMSEIEDPESSIIPTYFSVVQHSSCNSCIGLDSSCHYTS